MPTAGSQQQSSEIWNSMVFLNSLPDDLEHSQKLNIS